MQNRANDPKETGKSNRRVRYVLHGHDHCMLQQWKPLEPCSTYGSSAFCIGPHRRNLCTVSADRSGERKQNEQEDPYVVFQCLGCASQSMHRASGECWEMLSISPTKYSSPPLPVLSLLSSTGGIGCLLLSTLSVCCWHWPAFVDDVVFVLRGLGCSSLFARVWCRQ